MKKNILIVEDEGIVAFDIKRSLINAGYSVCGIVSNSKSALEKTELLRPDLILMDIMLSGAKDGIYTAREINKKYDTPIIFLTAYADDDSVAKVKSINSFGYIIKPFEERELYATIEMAFYRYKLETALKESEQKYRSLVESIEEGIVVVDENENITYANNAGASILDFPNNKELLGHNLAEFVVSANYEMLKIESQKRKRGESSRYELKMITYKKNEKIIKVSASPYTINGKFVGSFGILMDVTKLKKTDKELRLKTKLQEKLLESVQLLNSSLNVKEVLELIASTASDILAVPSCAIYLYDEKENLLNPVVAIDPEYQEETLNLVLDVDKSFTGRAVKQKKALIFNHTGDSKEGQYIPGTSQNSDERLIVTPFITEDKVFGAMTLIRIGKEFTEEDLILAQTYATFASTALKNAQVHKMLRREIDERKKATEKLEKSQFRLSTILKNVPNIILYEKKKLSFFISENIFQMLGYEKNEIKLDANMLTSLIYPDDNKYLQKKISRWLENGGTGILTTWYRIRKKNGTYIWIDDRMVLIRPVGGDTFISGVMIDNTNLKKVEERLRESESRYKAVVEDQTELLSRYLPDGTLTFVNEAYCSFYGSSKNYLIGTNWINKFSSSLREFINKKIAEISFKNPSSTYEYVMVNRTGNKHWLERTDRAIFDEYGKIIEFQSVARDITDRKLAEEQKNKIQTQLVQVQKMETIGRLAGGIAHDFNNLVTAINGYTDIIMKKVKKDDEIQQDLEVIKSCGIKAAKLTRQLLAFSRKQIIKPRLVNIDKIITSAVDMLKKIINQNITIQTELNTSTNKILIDPLQFEQILMNIIVNADDAMPDGGNIIVKTQNYTISKSINSYSNKIPPGDYIKLSIRDFGTGISTENLENIFEPFFTTKVSGRGTGLGLATVFGVVKQNHGFIQVNTEIDEGTEFVIIFPVSHQKENRSDDNNPNKEIDSKNVTILLVEDEDNIRDFIHDILNESGFKVIAVDNGKSARKTINDTDRIDILLTDIKMPEVSGNQVAKALLNTFPAAKVIYMSGYTDNDEIRNDIQNARAEFLQKPFTYQELINVIELVMKKQG